jgi:excisionase family DNA binding protein
MLYFMASKLTIDRGWLSLRELTEYASVSERTLREWLHRSTDALPAVRVDGKILVRRSEFDEWLEHHRIRADAPVDVDGIVNGLFEDVE